MPFPRHMDVLWVLPDDPEPTDLGRCLLTACPEIPKLISNGSAWSDHRSLHIDGDLIKRGVRYSMDHPLSWTGGYTLAAVRIASQPPGVFAREIGIRRVTPDGTVLTSEPMSGDLFKVIIKPRRRKPRTVIVSGWEVLPECASS